MKIINKENLKKYALNYLNRYATSKKNLEIILLRKIKKIDRKEEELKLHIISIINELENLNNERL